VRGVVLLLDSSINEVLVVSKNGVRQTAAVHPRDIGESLHRIVSQRDDAVWIECEVASGVVTQFFLVADEEKVDTILSGGEVWGVEEDVVNLCKSVWREARVSCEGRVEEEGARGACEREGGGGGGGAWREEMELFEHQVRTVAWMRGMEERFPMNIAYDGNIRMTSRWFVDTENECLTTTASVREAQLVGGLCADGMGRGKTAAVLRLINDTRMPRRPTTAESHYESRGTLVVLPLNLVGQWKSEIEKFIKPGCMTVLFVVQGRDVPSMSEALDADIVVTTFHFLRNNKVYGEMIDRCLRHRPRERYSLSAWARVPNRQECILEAICWRRVVVDEIHQTFERMGDVKQFRLLRAHALWGLSATPCIHNDQAQHLYSLLSREKAHHPNLLARLIEACVRSGVKNETTTAEKRSVRRISLSAEERILLEDSGGDTLAEKIRKVTFVDVSEGAGGVVVGGDEGVGGHLVSHVSVQRGRECAALRVKVGGHERSVRILEGVTQELRATLVRLLDDGGSSEEERDAARVAYETHQEDVRVAKGILHRQQLRLRNREAMDDTIQQRVQQIGEGVVCGLCGERGGHLNMSSSCLHMLCSSCVGANPACGVCGEMIYDAFPIETTRGVGTKMKEIASLVQSLDTPCILFVQWKTMVKGTRSFLRGMGTRVHTLDGNLSQRANALDSLHEEGVGVLLLCLDDGFAGLHLPHVWHVIFAHAIVGDRDRVMTLESQAVARCLRYGQTRDVKTYSFVVSNTEECLLYDRTHDMDI